MRGPFRPNWESLKAYRYPDWFRAAKFGIWAHWSPQCVPEQGDWYARGMYVQGNAQYNYHVKTYGHPSQFGYKDICHNWRAENWNPEELIRLYAPPHRHGPHRVRFQRQSVHPGPSETQQWAPGVVADPVRNGDSGSIEVSVNKLRAMHSQSAFSSERPGHEAAYAIDGSNGTVWQPAETDTQPTLTLDLVAPTEFETNQFFVIDSARIEFAAGRGGGFGARGATTPPGTAAAPSGGVTAFRYKVEASIDGKEYAAVLDKTKNDATLYTEFDEIPPTRCRFVRLTITDWPRRGTMPLGITEFTVFGKAAPAPMR
jgi:hypothetical protein